MLEYKNVVVENRKGKILNNISMTLEEGTILGLFGMDEKAKSMLLQITAGRVSDFRGKLLLDGKPIGSGKDKTNDIAYMQASYGFQVFLTVEENYDLILSLHGVKGRYRERRIDEVLEFMQLTEYKTTFVEEVPAEIYPFLYLGQLILCRPKWLVLEEPFRNLNADGRNRMANILLRIHERGVSMLINTKLSMEMTMLFTDIAIFENAKLVMCGPLDEVVERATKESTIRMHVLDGVENAIRILKRNDLVERIIIDRTQVSFRFFGQEKDEAQLLTDLVKSGALIQNFTRDPVDLEWYFRR